MTAPLSEEYLAKIKARCAAAYAGPWHVDNDSADLNRWVTDATGFLEINLGYRGNRNQAEAAFIAHAREDVPALVAEVARLNTILSAARSAAGYEPSPTPPARLSRVRVMPTVSGAWRVRYRLDGKRRSSSSFETRDQAADYATELRKRNSNPNHFAPTVQGDDA